MRHSQVQGRWPARDWFDERSLDRQYRIRDDAGRCYRSIRKHLYKTYVRRHVHCYRGLKKLTRDESLALDGDNTCTVCLAFLIWRMSVEGLLLVEGMNVRRNSSYDLRLMGPLRTYQLPLAETLRWTYFSFFGIWRELLYLSSRASIRVRLFSDHCEGHFHWRPEQLHESKATEVCRAPPLRFGLLFPDMSGVSDAALAKCKERIRKGAAASDEDRIWTNDVFSWTGRESDLRDCAFEIRFPQQTLRPRRFQYISI